MNRWLLIAELLFAFTLSAQDKPLYYFRFAVETPSNLLVSTKEDGSLLIKNRKSRKESTLYRKNTVYEFEPAFPNTKKESLKKIFRMTTDNAELPYLLEKNNPEMYRNIKPYFTTPEAVYPNDYGTTSPVPGSTLEFPLTNLDAMHVPQAWGITMGNPKVVIGISDAVIDSTNIDIQGRISQYLQEAKHNPNSNTCGHGITISSIAGGKANNGFGLPGICSDCDMIANGYGNFNYIQELVEAGAKVVNASWVLCGFGNYHKNVEKRINEYYDEGVLIVAAAGNAKNCNRYLRDHASNYGYPASYKNVISVSSVFGECGHYEDCIKDDPQYGTVAWKLKDRHVARYWMKNGSLDTLTPINPHWANNHNLAVDIVVPVETYIPGRLHCHEEILFGGATSTATAMVTGVIGLIWSANYCLSSAEVESILKLTAEDIENLPGNEPFKMKLGAGRLDAYRAVKMAHDMQLESGTVTVSGRDFYRFNFKLFSSPYQIAVQNQTFRDSSTVDFTARKRIRLLPGTRLSPDKQGFVKLQINPDLSTAECFPKEPKKREKVEKDSISSAPKFLPPFTVKQLKELQEVFVTPEAAVLDSDYEAVVTARESGTIIFKGKFKKDEIGIISTSNWPDNNEIFDLTLTSNLYRMKRVIKKK